MKIKPLVVLGENSSWGHRGQLTVRREISASYLMQLTTRAPKGSRMIPNPARGAVISEKMMLLVCQLKQCVFVQIDSIMKPGVLLFRSQIRCIKKCATDRE